MSEQNRAIIWQDVDRFPSAREPLAIYNMMIYSPISSK